MNLSEATMVEWPLAATNEKYNTEPANGKMNVSNAQRNLFLDHFVCYNLVGHSFISLQ